MGTPYTLSTPITTHQGTTAILDVNRPKAKAFVQYGNPYEVLLNYDADGVLSGVQTKFVPASVRGFLADMTGLSTIDIDMLDGYDYLQLQGRMRDIIGNPPPPVT
jgi:hypothetical protein